MKSLVTISAVALSLTLVLGLATTVRADPATRIWVDATGMFSVEARLVEIMDQQVVLIRQDGKQITIPVDMLSNRDKEYLEQRKKESKRVRNRLRETPRQQSQVQPLPILVLPPSQHTAPEGSVLSHNARRLRAASGDLDALPADPSPVKFDIAEVRIPIRKIDVSDTCSRPIPIITTDESGIRSTSVIISASSRASFATEASRNQLIRFDVASEKAVLALEYRQKIELLDHHQPSGRSLVLIGFNSLGQGGQLAIATGWNSNRIRLQHRRSLAETNQLTRLPHVHWARWIDDEHIVALIDRTLGMWNLVSGRQVYAIDDIDPRSHPALSGGRRYVAVPGHEGVQLYRTSNGQPLGQIESDTQFPGVSFSPSGNQLAVITSRRLVVWDLPSATVAGELTSRSGLGKGKPTWIDSDLVLTGNGFLLSIFRGLGVWRYDTAATKRARIGKHVALFRRYPNTELSIVSLPHQSASQAMQSFDSGIDEIESEQRVLGRSSWDANGWADRDVRVSNTPGRFR